MSLRSGSECTHIFGQSTAATISLVAAVSTQRVYVYSFIVVIGTPSINLTLQDTSSAAMTQAFQLLANGSFVLDYRANFEPWFSSGTGLGIQWFQTGTTNIGYDIWYIQGQ